MSLPFGKDPFDAVPHCKLSTEGRLIMLNVASTFLIGSHRHVQTVEPQSHL